VPEVATHDERASIDASSSVRQRRGGRFLVPVVVGCALFMPTLDSTVVATALPTMARSLHQDPAWLNIVITAYLLSLAVFIPLSAWLADRFGARSAFQAAIAIFTLGSILCGLSHSLAEIVAARFLQGFGGAMILPVGRLLVLRALPKADWVEGISCLAVPTMLGPAVGPPLGGLIVSYGTWRWIFFINVPVGLLAIAAAAIAISNVGEGDVPTLDVVGFVLSALGLLGLVLGIESIGHGLLPAGGIAGAIAAGMVCLGLYMIHARQAAHSIIDLRLLRIPTFAIAIVGGGLLRTGLEAMPFLLALLFQVRFGLSPFISGLFTFFSAACALTMKAAAMPIVRRVGFRSLLTVNCINSAAFMMLCAWFRPSTPYVVIATALLAGGFFRSLQFTSVAALCYADVPEKLIAEASTFASMTHQVFMSLGVGLAALVLNVSGAGQGLQLSAHGVSPAFLTLGAVSLLGTAVFACLSPDAGAELRQRRTS
jgi:EmrB/QacA subfamily drug resistance transporter